MACAVVLLVACGSSGEPEPDGSVCPASMTDGDICVDPAHGDDLAAGTRDAPVKTITHALELVGKDGGGRTVFLLDGTYDAPGGEQFPLAIPTTITVTGIDTVHGSEIEVTSAATSSAPHIIGEGQLVTMAGGSTLSHAIVISQGTSTAALDVDGATYGVHLNDVFVYGTKTSPVVVHGGELAVDDVQLGPQVDLQADGWITGSKLTLAVAESTMTTLRGHIDIASGTLRFRGGGAIELYTKLEATTLDVDSDADFSDLFPLATPEPGVPYMVYALDGEATLHVSAGTWKNVWLQDHDSDENPDNVFAIDGVTLAGSIVACITRPCELTGASLTANSEIWVNARATVSASRFADSALYALTGSDVVIRDSMFGEGATIVADTAISIPTKLDLGTSSAPGGNRFAGTPGDNKLQLGTSAFLVIRDWYSTVSAVGNTWLPNDSGADAQGHIASGTVTGWLTGKNIYKGSGTSITF
jgi:hypothetical protein